LNLELQALYVQELDISPGSVFQIAVTPTLLSTSEEARKRSESTPYLHSFSIHQRVFNKYSLLYRSTEGKRVQEK
jgi:hypothetical protein